jgi:hypothetical protein
VSVSDQAASMATPQASKRTHQQRSLWSVPFDQSGQLALLTVVHSATGVIQDTGTTVVQYAATECLCVC